MRTVGVAAASVLSFLLAPAAGAAPPARACDEAKLATIGDVDAALSSKAVEIVRLSSAAGGEARLTQLIDLNASFSLGAGDVGDPLGTYLAGARAMSRKMAADTYRFSIWSSIPTPVSDACGCYSVEVEFIDTAHNYSYPVKSTFSHGILIKAEGWRTVFTMGSVRGRNSR